VEIDLELLRRVFCSEAEEHLGEIEQALLALETSPDDLEALQGSFRSIHTLKGSASSVGWNRVADFAHAVEDLLERLRDGRLALSRTVMGLLLESVDSLRAMIETAADCGEEPEGDSVALGRRIAAILRGAGDPPSGATLASSPRSAFAERALRGVRSATSLRVGTEKLDRLLDLAGEMVIAGAAFQRLLHEIDGTRGERLRDAFRESARLTLELQEQVSSVRMIPVGPTLRQYVRIARDLCVSLGKHATVKLEGEDVEVDAAIVEHLKDPLTHIVRNAIDHGIERPEVRVERGKHASGSLMLRAAHRAGGISIECADDGVGLDRARILERAQARGLVRGGLPLSDAHVNALIFEEGLSTAREVTELSGRGVGMGVVRRNIEALGGSVSIDGEPGRGTTVSIWLPLTLAIIDALAVALDDETFLIPLTSVVECFDLPVEQRAQRTGMLQRGGATLSWVRLTDLLQGAGDAARPAHLVVVQHEERRVALAVDAFRGTQQIVIKPLARIFRNLAGVSGCTILHSGRVALILDVETLLRLAGQTPTQPRLQARPSPPRAPHPETSP
jgi:two-component system, chemotaxis family, sensor kinase CheA